MANTNTDQLVSAPKSTANSVITELAYLTSYDVIANKDYAYVAYKEEKPDTGKWILRIKAKVTAGASIDPSHPILRSNMSAAAQKGEEYIVFGFNMTPTDTDPRLVENRLYFDKSLKPTRVEIHLVTRNADGSPTEEQVAKFDWPA